MKSLRSGVRIFAIAMAMGILVTACRSAWVVVPQPEGGYSAADTLRGRLKGDEVRVTFRFDTITRTRIITRTDTLFREGADTVIRVERLLHTDTVLRVDTVRVPVTVTETVDRLTTRTDTVVRVDTVMAMGPRPTARVDTIHVPVTQTVVRVDTVLRVDTVQVSATETVVRTDTVVRVDTVRVPVTETVVRTDTVVRVDTVRLAVTDTLLRVDTVRLAVTDTIRVTVTDTVVRTEVVERPGRRLLFVPPGHYPPEGQCRVWVHGVQPGQQARAAACDALGEIPDGAFVLFGGDAWDFDYDWLAEAARNPGAVPPEIIGLKRRG